MLKSVIVSTSLFFQELWLFRLMLDALTLLLQSHRTSRVSIPKVRFFLHSFLAVTEIGMYTCEISRLSMLCVPLKLYACFCINVNVSLELNV